VLDRELLNRPTERACATAEERDKAHARVAHEIAAQLPFRRVPVGLFIFLLFLTPTQQHSIMPTVDFVSEETFYQLVPARNGDLTTVPELRLDRICRAMARVPPKGQRRNNNEIEAARAFYLSMLKEDPDMPPWRDLMERLEISEDSSVGKVQLNGRALIPFKKLYRRAVDSFGECRTVEEFRKRVSAFGKLYHVRTHDLEKIRVASKPQQPSAGVRAQAAQAPRVAAVSANMIANDDDDNDDTKEDSTKKDSKEDDTTTNTCTPKKTTSEDALVCTEQSRLAEFQHQCQPR